MGKSIRKSDTYDIFGQTTLTCDIFVCTDDINGIVPRHIETVCQLVLRRSPVLNIDVYVEELAQDKRGQATYSQIKEYVLEHSDLKASSLYIAQVKQKCGIIERENYNKPKSKNAKQPKCPTGEGNSD